MNSARAIHRVEQLALNAWPALRQYLLDGWLIRMADGYTKRANSVQPIGEIPDPPGLPDRIAACEHIYAEAGLPTIFKLTPYSVPQGLDLALEELGYRIAEPSRVMIRPLASVAKPDAEASVSTSPSDEWLARFAGWKGESPADAEKARQLLSDPYPLRGFFTLCHDGMAVACGIGAVERGYVGLYDIVTGPAHRNRGFGEQLILHILQWARERGARFSYLQVVASNAPALRLYEKLGYKEAYDYWYRVKDLQ